MKFASLFLAAASAFAQHAIAPPQVGFIEDASRAMRPVYGMPGNFILGSSITGSIVSEAFSGALGLVKTDTSLDAFNAAGKLLASMDVPAGPALFAFSPDGTGALAYLLANETFFAWRGSAFARIPNHPVEREVVAITFPSPSEATLIVQRGYGNIWQVNVPLETRGILGENALTGVRPPLLALSSGGLVYTGSGGIVVRQPTGAEVHLDATLPDSFSLQQMNQNWVELAPRGSTARFAIRTTAGREGLYRLPE